MQRWRLPQHAPWRAPAQEQGLPRRLGVQRLGRRYAGMPSPEKSPGFAGLARQLPGEMPLGAPLANPPEGPLAVHLRLALVGFRR